MSLTLFNTLTRKIEKFKPIKKGCAGLYTCGPTVYNYAHIGNLRTYIFEDILKRVLLFDDYEVKHVMNITDVGHLTSDADEGEDKMKKSARRERKTAWEIAEFYTNAFKNDLKELNVIEPNIWCRATDHIKEQVDLVQKLTDKSYTYETTDGIYFDTTKLKDYGKLANLKKQKLKTGVRVDLGEKKNPHDFALWKFSVRLSPPARACLSGRQGGDEGGREQKRQMEWNAFGQKGFPGWHIECSAMSEKYLGVPFDIHCGGVDHIPVHHTNEIAQSEAANGKPLANYWLHGEFLVTGTAKMAKSEGNFLTLQTIKEKGLSPIAYRYFLLQTHYRKQLNFSWEALAAAQKALHHLCRSFTELPAGGENKKLSEKFLEFVANDLDIPGALALTWQAIKERKISKKQLLKFDKVFGLQLAEIKEEKNKIPKEVRVLVKQRQQARQNKNWTESDLLRKKIEAGGVKVKDKKDGSTSISFS